MYERSLLEYNSPLHQKTCIVSEIWNLIHCCTPYMNTVDWIITRLCIIIAVLYRRVHIYMHFYMDYDQRLFEHNTPLGWEPMGIQHPSASKDLYCIRDLTCDNILTQFDELWVHIWMHFLHGFASKYLYCIGDLTFDESDTVWWIATIEITLPWKHNWHIVSETWVLYAFLHIFMIRAYGNRPPLCIKRLVLYGRYEFWYIVVHLIWIQSIELSLASAS